MKRKRSAVSGKIREEAIRSLQRLSRQFENLEEMVDLLRERHQLFKWLKEGTISKWMERPTASTLLAIEILRHYQESHSVGVRRRRLAEAARKRLVQLEAERESAFDLVQTLDEVIARQREIVKDLEPKP